MFGMYGMISVSISWCTIVVGQMHVFGLYIYESSYSFNILRTITVIVSKYLSVVYVYSIYM
jgi:hypothetical protein